MTTGKTIALTRQTLVGKVMSLLFNMLYRLVITFLPRSKHLLISCLQSPSAVIWGPQKIKSDTSTGHLIQKADSLGKTLILVKMEGRRKRGQQRKRWLDSITDSMDMSLSKFQEIVKDRKAWVTKSRTQVSE